MAVWKLPLAGPRGSASRSSIPRPVGDAALELAQAHSATSRPAPASSSRKDLLRLSDTSQSAEAPRHRQAARAAPPLPRRPLDCRLSHHVTAGRPGAASYAQQPAQRTVTEWALGWPSAADGVHQPATAAAAGGRPPSRGRGTAAQPGQEWAGCSSSTLATSNRAHHFELPGSRGRCSRRRPTGGSGCHGQRWARGRHPAGQW